MTNVIHQKEHRAEKKKAKNDFEKDFFNLMNNSVFEKTMVKVKNVETANL